VLFDAGNTLIHMPRSAEAILQDLCLQIGVSVTPEQAHTACRASEQYYSDHYLAFRGDQGAFWKSYHSAALASIGVEDADGTKAEALSHGFGRSGVWQAYPDAAPVCERLRERGLKLGVVSNASITVRDLLSQAGLLHLFEVVIASQDLGIQKPDPLIFHAALTTLGVDPSEALYAGDLYEVDFLGAQGAGLAAVLIDREGTTAFDCPTLRSLDELLHLVAPED
jgi:putative hydrolase of the HAD superfamily